MAAISTPGSTTSGGGDYPLTFAVDYPNRSLNRLSTAFRIVTIIPIVILATALEGGSFASGAGNSGARYAVGGIGILVIPVVLMLLFRKKYPRWWYDWNLQLTRFSNRITAYIALRTTTTPPPTNSNPSTWTSPTPTPNTTSAAVYHSSNGS